MSYDILATSKTPALIIYVLDVSASMGQKMGSRRRIDIVMDAMGAALRQMVFRSTKGSRVAPRYRIAMYAYSDHVFDLVDGVKTVDQVAALGVPDLSPMRTSHAAKAFAQVERLLEQELPNLKDCPAPLVCHMTDGEFTGDDPEPIVKRIMDMEVPDGKVLVENIFISERILQEPISNPNEWQGVLSETRMATDFAKRLKSMSSMLPESYRAMMLETGYSLKENAVMMLPGISPELVEMGFVMSAATPIGHGS
jgi:hypothetical protein